MPKHGCHCAYKLTCMLALPVIFCSQAPWSDGLVFLIISARLRSRSPGESHLTAACSTDLLLVCIPQIQIGSRSVRPVRQTKRSLESNNPLESAHNSVVQALARMMFLTAGVDTEPPQHCERQEEHGAGVWREDIPWQPPQIGHRTRPFRQDSPALSGE